MLFTQRDRGHLGVGEEIGVKLEICQVANLCRGGHCILSMMFFFRLRSMSQEYSDTLTRLLDQLEDSER